MAPNWQTVINEPRLRYTWEEEDPSEKRLRPEEILSISLWREKMELTRRDCLKLTAVTAMGALLAACKPAATPTPAAQKPAQQPAAKATEKPTEPPAKKEPVEISYLVRNDIELKMKEWTDVTVKEFQEMNPDIKVNTIGVPWGDYNAKLMALYAAGTPPEISANYAAGFATFYANDAIVPLDEFVKANNVDLGVFDKSCIDALTREGKLWAMPLAHMPYIMYYNKEPFDAAGVDVPPTDWADKTWTTDRLLEISQKISHDTDDPTKGLWGIDFPTGQLGVMSWLWGKDPFNNKGGPELTEAYKTGIVTEVYYTQPEVVAMHKFRRDLAYEYHVEPRPSDTDILKQVQSFVIMTQRLAMTIAGGWHFANFFEVKPSWPWGVAPVPYGPAGKNTTPLFNDSWMLSKGCKHPEEGFKFLTYLTIGKGAEHYARITGFIPANKTYLHIFFDSVMESGNVSQTRETIEQVVRGAYEYGYVTPGKTLDRYPEWNKAYNQTTAPIWNDEVTVEEGMQAVQEKFENLIKTA